jgi:hypothetical protein
MTDALQTNSTLFGQVEPGYAHYRKWAQPAPALVTPHVHLKWYVIHPEALPIAAARIDDAQAYLRDEIAAGRLKLDDEVGFVVHHRVPELEILYVCTWRGNNEVWETLYHKRLLPGLRFTEFQRTNTSPTFCVWVLSAVTHEMKAWTRFLSSPRGADDRNGYLADQLTGWV